VGPAHLLGGVRRSGWPCDGHTRCATAPSRSGHGGEIAVGSALLLPVVPAAVAGAALAGFSAGLLGLYVRTPGMRRGRFDPRSTPEGLPISKDVWMLGAGLALLVDGATDD
jgi:hypothetical protein